MNKNQIIKQVADKTGVDILTVTEVTNSLFETITDTFKAKKNVTVPGLGIFKVVKRKARKAIHPYTLEKTKFRAYFAVTFKPSKVLKTKVNGQRRKRRKAKD